MAPASQLSTALKDPQSMQGVAKQKPNTKPEGETWMPPGVTNIRQQQNRRK